MKYPIVLNQSNEGSSLGEVNKNKEKQLNQLIAYLKNIMR